MNELQKNIERHITYYVESAKADGVVIGVSGGLDSAVVLKLCLNALGKDRVTAVYLPDGDPSDLKIDPHIHRIATDLGIQIPFIHITDIVSLFKYKTDENLNIPMDKLAEINTKARIRMVMLYAIANSNNLLVVGTSNKSEIMTGYFTKYGDGGVDFEPIGNLYKTEVIELAKHLWVPEEIINRPPSAGLYEGQTDEEELGMTYDELDKILKKFNDFKKYSRKDMSEKELKVCEMFENTWHKRCSPPILKG